MSQIKRLGAGGWGKKIPLADGYESEKASDHGENVSESTSKRSIHQILSVIIEIPNWLLVVSIPSIQCGKEIKVATCR